MSLHINVCVMCGGALAPAQLRSVDQFVRSAANADTQPFTLESGGERKHVTVLFADIVGSTQLIEGLDPEDAYEILQPTIRIMMDAVHRYGGTVNQVLGDGIMALFGAPLAQEKHATMACLSALLMQTNAERINRSRQSEEKQPVRMRVGLNSGEVVVRAIENDLEFDYRAIGHDVHFADKMQANAAPGEILASPETARLAGDLVMTEAVYGVLPEAFRVMDTRIEDDNEGSVSARTLSKMVGRKSELRALAVARDSALRSDARIVGITGAPGIGKSRLLYEFTKALPTETGRVLWCAAALQDSSAPLRPIVRLMQRTFGVASDSDEHTARKAIEQRLAELEVPADTALAALLELLGHAPSDPAWIALDPPDRRRHITDTILTVLIGECLAQPVALVVEDLQFADVETCGIVDKLVENARSLPFLMLVSYRPEIQHDWEHQTHFLELRLEPLRRVDALDLLDGHLGTHASLDPIKETLIERTDGIPFFLEECILHIIESGQLAGTPGDYSLHGALEDIAVPRSVHDVIASRIDHLPPLDKQVLVAAAVVGKDVSSGLLREIVALPPEDYAACIERLHHAEFIDEARLFPELELTFRHALIQEVAYGTLLRDRRRGLHGRIVEIMEVRYSANLDDQIERLAHHAIEGQLWDKSVTYCRQAGQKSLARSAANEAVEFFERALEIISRREGAIANGEKVDLLLDMADACYPLSQWDRANECIREASDLAVESEPHRVCRAHTSLALYKWTVGDLSSAKRSGERALEIARGSKDKWLQVHTTARLGAVCLDTGDYPAVIDLFSEAIDSLHESDTHDRFGLAALPAAVCRTAMAWSYAQLGEFDLGILVGEEGLRHAEDQRHPFSVIYCCYEMGNVFALRGDFNRAAKLLERGREVCESTMVPALLPMVDASLGNVYVQQGRGREGLSLLTSASEQLLSQNLKVRLARILTWKANAQLRAGNTEEALKLGLEAVELAERHGERGHEAWARLCVADAYRLQSMNDGNLRLAQEAYGRVRNLAVSLGLQPLIAHYHYGYSELQSSTGRTSAMLSELDQADGLFRTLNMSHWVEEIRIKRAVASGDGSGNVIPFRKRASN